MGIYITIININFVSWNLVKEVFLIKCLIIFIDKI